MAVPMIPGLLSTQRHFIGRTNFHKGQLLERMALGKVTSAEASPSSHLPVDKKASPSAWLNVAAHHRPDATSNQVQSAASTEPAAPSTKFRKDATQPKWITHDRQVLRFFGFFLEPVVHETTHTAPSQHHRVRRVVLFFYLSDHSISISEPRVANSGIAQGEFMKRTVVATPRGEPFEPRDFHVGGHVKLYGRTIQLVDCDDATRSYYDEAAGVLPQAAPHKYPDDRGSQVDEIDELKQRLRAKAATLAESKAEKVRKFHAHSQRVLRFFVSWQDPHPLYPETRKYVLHYYLSDDTMEIVEPRGEREGRGHFAVLLSRRRMVRDDKKNAFVGDKDLRCGDFVHVFSRRFLLEDCDAFTREYYLETHGVTQETFEPEAAARCAQAAKWKVFQVDASHIRAQLEKGSARGDRLTLTAAAGDKSRQFYENDALEKKQLRFRARFHGVQATDANGQREFVLTFFLEDDTLSVFEPRVQNSGVAGGRFLDRGRFRKCCVHGDGGTLSREKDKDKSAYRASDFYVGAVVAFEFAPQQKLELIEADRQTLAFCESHPERFPFSDAEPVLHGVARALSRGKGPACSLLRRACRTADSSRSGVLQVGEACQLLERLGLARELNAQQLVTLCRKFEADALASAAATGDREHAGPLPFRYDDFCDAVSARVARANAAGSGDVFDRLRQCEHLRRLLRDASPPRQLAMETAELAQIASAYKISLSSSDLAMLCTKFPGGSRRSTVHWSELCDRVFSVPGEDSGPRSREMMPRGTAARKGCEGDDSDQYPEEHEHERELQNGPLHSLRQRATDDADDDGASDDEFAGFGDDDAGDACLPETAQLSVSDCLASPRRTQMPPVPALPVRQQTGTMARPRGKLSAAAAVDARVVALLRRVFGERKYQLRKALRDHDVDKRGVLGEEAFMAAVLAVEPRLGDGDTYLIADVYFPTNNSQVDYGKLLESAFRA